MLADHLSCCAGATLRLLGRGIEADPEGAFHDFQAGAAAGDPFAIFNLGGSSASVPPKSKRGDLKLVVCSHTS
jgi:hypothetical protein